MLKIVMFKRYGIPCNDLRVATLSNLYLTVTGIIITGLISNNNSTMPKLTITDICY